LGKKAFGKSLFSEEKSLGKNSPVDAKPFFSRKKPWEKSKKALCIRAGKWKHL